MFGDLSASRTEPAARGPEAPEFRQLARAGLDNARDQMLAACEQMPRRPAARPPTPQPASSPATLSTTLSPGQ